MKILIFVIIPLPKILNNILWFSVFRQIVSFQSRQKALYTNVIYFGRQTQKSTGWSWPSCAFLITTQANSNLLRSGNVGFESFALRWTTDLPCQTRKTRFRILVPLPTTKDGASYVVLNGELASTKISADILTSLPICVIVIIESLLEE